MGGEEGLEGPPQVVVESFVGRVPLAGPVPRLGLLLRCALPCIGLPAAMNWLEKSSATSLTASTASSSWRTARAQ